MDLLERYREDPEGTVEFLGGDKEMSDAFSNLSYIERKIDAIPDGVRSASCSTDLTFLLVDRAKAHKKLSTFIFGEDLVSI